MISACTAPGSRSRRHRVHTRSVGKRCCPVLTAAAAIQWPAARSGTSPPAIPKLMMPETPRSTADLRAARSCNPWLQMTDTPGPRAIRASRASEVTAIMPPGMQLPPLNRLFVSQRVDDVNQVTSPNRCRINLLRDLSCLALFAGGCCGTALAAALRQAALHATSDRHLWPQTAPG